MLDLFARVAVAYATAVIVDVVDAVFLIVIGMKLSTISRQVTAAGQLGGSALPGESRGQAGKAFRATPFELDRPLRFLAALLGRVDWTGRNPAGVGTVVVPVAELITVVDAEAVFVIVCVDRMIVEVVVVTSVAVKVSVDCKTSDSE